MSEMTSAAVASSVLEAALECRLRKMRRSMSWTEGGCYIPTTRTSSSSSLTSPIFEGEKNDGNCNRNDDDDYDDGMNDCKNGDSGKDDGEKDVGLTARSESGSSPADVRPAVGCGSSTERRRGGVYGRETTTTATTTETKTRSRIVGRPRGRRGLRRLASSDYGPSEEIEAAVSDVWETLERLDTFLLGDPSFSSSTSSSATDSLSSSSSSNSSRPLSDAFGAFDGAFEGAFQVIDNRGVDGSWGGADLGRETRGEDDNLSTNCEDNENDSLDTELDELRRSEDDLKRDLDALSLDSISTLKFVCVKKNDDDDGEEEEGMYDVDEERKNEMEGDEGSVNDGNQLIVEFPHPWTGSGIDGRRERMEEWRRRRKRRQFSGAILRIVGEIGLAVWSRRWSDRNKYRADKSKDELTENTRRG